MRNQPFKGKALLLFLEYFLELDLALVQLYIQVRLYIKLVLIVAVLILDGVAFEFVVGLP